MEDNNNINGDISTNSYSQSYTTSQWVVEPQQQEHEQPVDTKEQHDTKIDALLVHYELGVADIPPPSPHLLWESTFRMLEEQPHK